MRLDHLGRCLDELDQHALPADGAPAAAFRVDEADVVAGAPLADPPRREAHALSLEPVDGGREVVDPEAHVVQRRLVDARLPFRIDRLHQVDLDREGAPAGGRDVLVHVLRLAAEGPARREAKEVDPEVPEARLGGRADGDLLDAEDRKRSICHGISGSSRLGNAFSNRRRLPPQAPGEEIALAAPLATRGRAERLRALEAGPETALDGAGLGALEDLDQEVAARAEDLRHEALHGEEELLLQRAVAVAQPGELRGGVAEDDVGEAARRLADPGGEPGSGEVRLEQSDLRFREGLHRRDVHPDHAPAAPDPGPRHLEPAPRPAAEVHHPRAAREQPVALVELRELVGRARPEALALRAPVEAVLAVVAARSPRLGRT